jgi:cellulose synthase/poly-beta-1,6-N-acetylglucosamine synthase-like glycosyltransferase
MLDSVARQSAWRAARIEHRQLVVYANGCSDHTADAARAWAAGRPDVQVVETTEKGKSQAWNAVKAYLRGDAPLWFFVDADVILHWRAVEALLAAAAAHPEAAVLSSLTVAAARYVPVRHRGFLESARVESERWKTQRRVVSARFYAIRREVAEGIELPPGLLDEDLYLTRLLGSERVWRSDRARVFAREPATLREIARYQVRTRIGTFQARRVSGPPVDSNKTPEMKAQRRGVFWRLSWKGKVGKLLWVPLKVWVEWRARRVPPESLSEDFWMNVASAKLGTAARRERPPA